MISTSKHKVTILNLLGDPLFIGCLMDLNFRFFKVKEDEGKDFLKAEDEKENKQTKYKIELDLSQRYAQFSLSFGKHL